MGTSRGSHLGQLGKLHDHMDPLGIIIRDTAMEPEVCAGTPALLEACACVGPPGVYVFDAAGEQLVRRVDRLHGGVLRLSAPGCDPAYLMPAPAANAYWNTETGETARLDVVGRLLHYLVRATP